ncbi:sensor domain-containing protein [Mycolicibacterium palauense]|uniref:sensor domain-containing protein n=1 Tax=Mycolicibacterium palauense TaxID=2034511 RepID=UPI000BFEE69D|nr:sensor domain-containing protein [Mycolicibacterium palauense]
MSKARRPAGGAAAALGTALAVLVATACTRDIAGVPVLPYTETPGPPVTLALHADDLMLDLERIRGITGTGRNLTAIPTMDASAPVDIDLLADDVPAPCRFVFAETATFGPEVADFHKTTYQAPPDSGVISQGAAVYRDPAAARRAFESLAGQAEGCAATGSGVVLLGAAESGPDRVRTRTGSGCGRDYRLKSVVLAEITFCAFPASVPEIVMTNLLRAVPG